MSRGITRERLAARIDTGFDKARTANTRVTYVHVDTTDTRAIQIARKFYAECFAGYYHREWESLPVSQQYRFIRAAYQVLDMIEDWA